MDILLLNGPNLNMLGTREPAQYGTQTLEDIVARIGALATDAGLSIEHHQDNSEVGLIDKVHAASKNGTKYIIIHEFFYFTNVHFLMLLDICNG
jgi:3-dehydroquinate dehydratase-2